jgi:hypothetical protein
MTEANPDPIVIDTGNRTCPGCAGTDFNKAVDDSSAGRAALGGYRFECRGCGWRGFAMQLAAKPAADITPPELSGLLEASAAWAAGSVDPEVQKKLPVGKPYGKA